MSGIVDFPTPRESTWIAELDEWRRARGIDCRQLRQLVGWVRRRAESIPRCTATTVAGTRCKNEAEHDDAGAFVCSDGPDRRTLCVVHAKMRRRGEGWTPSASDLSRLLGLE